MIRTRTLTALTLAPVLFGCAAAPPPSAELTAGDYAAAAALVEGNLRGLVRNQTVEPHWIGADGDFWYRRDEADGHTYVRFHRRTGARLPLFDHAALAAALGGALGAESKPTAGDLGITAVTIDDELRTLTGRAGERVVRCDLASMSCTASVPEAGLLPSPDGRRAALIRDFNLVVRELTTGRETPLTADGAEHYAYGSLTDGSLITIPRRRTGMVLPPLGTTWSPDGRYLLVPRNDERSVRVNPFVEWVPQDGSRRPILHPIRSAFTGDRERVVSELFVFEVASGRRVAVAVPARYAAGLTSDPLGWSVARGQVFLLARAPGAKSAAVLRVDLATGGSTIVIEESSPTRVETNTVEYNVPNIRILGDGRHALWYSTRSGWGHLYRYDAQTGDLLNAVTAGDWAVIDVLAVDERRGEVYFTGAAREPDRDPYYRHLYKAPVAGGPPALLTSPDADHHFEPARSPLIKLLFRTPDPAPRIHPEAGVLLDTYSTVSEPPVTVLRSTADGRQLAEVERADASALFAAGWRPPVRERVKAADGTTDLYAVYYAPLRPIGRRQHPVIDAVYGGPQVIVTPRNFVEAYAAANPLGESGLARLGFAMVTVDGRGTPGRSAAFRDAGYPEFTQVAIDDHIAAIRQLADRHPEMDLERVGIYGWSWGGTFSAQAILSRPAVYRVAVSGAGVYDYAALYEGFDKFTGLPRYGDGSPFRTRPDEAPASWRSLDITAMADSLRGRLLLVYGDLDENVPPSQVFRLVDALVKANKDYDLLYLPNRTHGGGGEGYTIRRTWDYFVEHLLGVAPVPGVEVVVKPASPL